MSRIGVSVAIPGSLVEAASRISPNDTLTEVPASASGLSLTFMEICRELPVSSPGDIAVSYTHLDVYKRQAAEYQETVNKAGALFKAVEIASRF